MQMRHYSIKYAFICVQNRNLNTGQNQVQTSFDGKQESAMFSKKLFINQNDI